MKKNFCGHDEIYTTLTELINTKKLMVDGLVVDITTPVEIFDNILCECKNLGIKNVIIEKPFIAQKDDCFSDFNLIMTQNYLYSKAFRFVKDYIKNSHLNIRKITCNFSKDRTLDSAKNRGTIEKVLECMYIEIPHQVYMISDSLGNDLQCIKIIQKDMKLPNAVLNNHGCCYIEFLKQGDVDNTNVKVFLLSNLLSKVLRKCLAIHFDNDISVFINFPTYKPNIEKISDCSIKICRNSELILKKVFVQDDMMTHMLKDYINAFEKKKINNIYANRIKQFIKIYENLKRI